MNEAEDSSQIEEMRLAYKAAVDAWVASIREEEALALQANSIANCDEWEAAHFREEEFRQLAKKAKKNYEDAIRKELFGF